MKRYLLGKIAGILIGAILGTCLLALATFQDIYGRYAVGAILGSVIGGVFGGGRIGLFGWSLLSCTFVGTMMGHAARFDDPLVIKSIDNYWVHGAFVGMVLGLLIGLAAEIVRRNRSLG